MFTIRTKCTDSISFHLFSQTALDRGTVLRMGKGFVMSNVEGRDLSDMFHEAFKRKVSTQDYFRDKTRMNASRLLNERI